MPIRNAVRAHVQGTRNAGTMNMQKPVAIPNGGMMIFFTVTAVRPSRMRHANTPSRPINAPIAELAKLRCTMPPTSTSIMPQHWNVFLRDFTAQTPQNRLHRHDPEHDSGDEA